MAVFLSRVLGLVREQVFAYFFGAGLFNDAWQVAYRIPNLFRDLFAEGALSSAFVPTFTDALEKQGRQGALLLANLVLSWLMALLGLLALAFFLFSEAFIYLLAAGFSEVPGKIEVASTLLQILSPFLMLVAAASVAMGILNAFNHYFLPALAPALFNLSLILAGFFLVPRFEQAGVPSIYAMGAGALAGGLLQFAVQLPLLRRHGYRFRFAITTADPGVRRIARLIGPAILGASAVQINILVNTQIASFLQENGPVSWLSYAFRIIYLPIGLFGVAVGVVNLREVSRFAARRELDRLKETLAASVKLVSFLAIPSSVGLIVLAGPVVRVLFERGGFTASDTLFTSYAVMFYSVGLFAYSCAKVYVPTFYALDDTRTPVRISFLAVVLNLVINLTLVFGVLPRPYRYLGLALGLAASVSVSSLLLARALRRRLGSFAPFGVRTAVAKNAAAAAAMGLLVWRLDRMLGSWQGQLSGQLAALAVCIVAGALSYFLLCRLMGVEEIGHLYRRRTR